MAIRSGRRIRRLAGPASGVLAGVVLAAGLTGPARADDSPWRRVPVRGVQPQAALSGVAARAVADAWAVGHEAGTAQTPGEGRPLALHWNGHAWRRAPFTGVTWTGDLKSVAASGRASAWATGTDADGGSHLLRWNGRRWAETGFPGQDAGATAYKVFAGPHGETWLLTGGTPGFGLLRRAGGTWQSVPDPPSASWISGIRILGPGRVWATGTVPTGPQFGDSYAARWDGTSWHELPVYDGGLYEGFVDVAPVSGDDVWAVGTARGIGTVSPLVPVLAHWDGTTWTKTPMRWIEPPNGLTVGSVTSLALDARNRPAWIALGDTWGNPPNAAAYARFENGEWVEHYGPTDSWQSHPRMHVTQIPGRSTYWSAGQAIPETGIGNTEPRIEHSP